MKLEELMKLALSESLEGMVSNIQFKTERGFLYTQNRVTLEWVRPSITSFWFKHDFIVKKNIK